MKIYPCKSPEKMLQTGPPTSFSGKIASARWTNFFQTKIDRWNIAVDRPGPPAGQNRLLGPNILSDISGPNSSSVRHFGTEQCAFCVGCWLSRFNPNFSVTHSGTDHRFCHTFRDRSWFLSDIPGPIIDSVTDLGTDHPAFWVGFIRAIFEGRLVSYNNLAVILTKTTPET